MHRTTLDRSFALQCRFNLHRESLSTFLDICPYDISELRAKNNKREISDWRHVFITLAFIHFKHWKNAGDFCHRDHASVIYSVKVIENEIPEINQIIKRVVKNEKPAKYCLPKTIVTFTPQYV